MGRSEPFVHLPSSRAPAILFKTSLGILVLAAILLADWAWWSASRPAIRIPPEVVLGLLALGAGGLALAVLPPSRARPAAAALGCLVALVGGEMLLAAGAHRWDRSSLFASAAQPLPNPVLGDVLVLSGVALGLASSRRRAARVVAHALGVGVLATCTLGAGADVLARCGWMPAAAHAAVPLPAAAGFALATLALAAWLEMRGTAGTLLFARNGSARVLRRALPLVFAALAAIHAGILGIVERGGLPLAAGLGLLLVANSIACGLIVLVSVRCVLPSVRALLADLESSARTATVVSLPTTAPASRRTRDGSHPSTCAILDARRREGTRPRPHSES